MLITGDVVRRIARNMLDVLDDEDVRDNADLERMWDVTVQFNGGDELSVRGIRQEAPGGGEDLCEITYFLEGYGVALASRTKTNNPGASIGLNSAGHIPGYETVNCDRFGNLMEYKRFDSGSVVDVRQELVKLSGPQRLFV